MSIAMKLNKNLIKTFKKISKGLSGAEKRLFIAEITRTFLEGNARQGKQRQYLDGIEMPFISGLKKSPMALSVMWIFMTEETNRLKK